MKGPLLITLDGPSGSGKSTVSVKLAHHFQIPCLDTGAMYRTLAYEALQRGVAIKDEMELVEIVKTLSFKFGFDKSEPWAEVSIKSQPYRRLGKEIRTPEVSLAASAVAKLKKVRECLVAIQRKIGLEKGGVIEGRDAGTVIFPQAKVKFFLTASADERAKRRHLELVDKLGAQTPPLQVVKEEMAKRDHQDSSRVESPLKPADDAVVVDTTGMNMDDVVAELIQKVGSIVN